MKSTHLLLALLLGSAPLFGGCFLKSMAVDSIADSLAGTGDTFSSDNDVQLVGEAVPFSLKLMESVLAATPRHTGLLTALSKNFTQYGYAYIQSRAEAAADDSYKESRELKLRAKKLYVRARDYGLRGLETRFNNFGKDVRKDPQAAVKRAEKKDVELLYWTGVAWMAAISLGKDDASLISDVPQAEALIYKAYALDPDYDQGSIHDFLITYEGSRPAMMGGSVKKAKEHFEASLKLNQGEHASTYVNYAEAVCLKEQDKACFEEMLDKALALDPDHKVSSRLVNLIMQKRARWLRSRMDKLFVD
jgi:predicted anti-sigma-YlaC factor YlaD